MMCLADCDGIEQRELKRVASGELRIVHAQRKRKLRKLGHRVWWNAVLRAWVWTPTWYKQKGEG